MPFYLDLVLNDPDPNSINYGVNADLQGLSSLEVMDKVVKAAADRGMMIMFDLHSFQAGTFMSVRCNLLLIILSCLRFLFFFY